MGGAFIIAKIAHVEWPKRGTGIKFAIVEVEKGVSVVRINSRKIEVRVLSAGETFPLSMNTEMTPVSGLLIDKLLPGIGSSEALIDYLTKLDLS